MDKEPGEDGVKVFIEGKDYFLPDEENPWKKARQAALEKQAQKTVKDGGSTGVKITGYEGGYGPSPRLKQLYQEYKRKQQPK